MFLVAVENSKKVIFEDCFVYDDEKTAEDFCKRAASRGLTAFLFEKKAIYTKEALEVVEEA